MRGRTVIYGGSFDPPHVSHQLSCLYLLEACEAAEVWVVPSFTHPFGKDLTPFTARFAMCELMVRPFARRVRVLDVERQLGGHGRTFDTVTHLQTQHPQVPLALAVGSDIVAETPRWHRWAELAALLPVIIIGRAGYPHPGCPVELPAVASRAVRELARQGKSLAGLVPASVDGYIGAHALYA